MKTSRNLALMLLCMMGILIPAAAQNYKAPKIDASGKVYNSDNKRIGSISKEGVILDAKGNKVAYIDSDGSLIDNATGKKIGKAEKNGNYLPSYHTTGDKGWTVDTPMNGTCMVRDKDGKVVAEVHENYKEFGACAMHCLQNQMNHSETMDKSALAKGYHCPMHPDKTSDKPATCPICKMDMVKDK